MTKTVQSPKQNVSEGKTSMEKVGERARRMFFVLTVVLLFITVPVFAHDVRSGYFESKLVGPFTKLLEEIEESSKAQVPTVPPVRKYNVETSGSVKTNIQINVENNVKTVTPTTVPQKVYVPPKQCNRYTVTHLDGSTSNLCYSKSDYDQLRSLGSKLSSAKTFYEFHLEGVERYQDEYERSGSDIYLDAKASSQASADREKEKINQVTLQMQTIEEKGY